MERTSYFQQPAKDDNYTSAHRSRDQSCRQSLKQFSYFKSLFAMPPYFLLMISLTIAYHSSRSGSLNWCILFSKSFLNTLRFLWSFSRRFSLYHSSCTGMLVVPLTGLIGQTNHGVNLCLSCECSVKYVRQCELYDFESPKYF